MRLTSLTLLALGAAASQAQIFPAGSLVVTRVGNGTVLESSGRGGASLLVSGKLVGAPSVAHTFPLNNGTPDTASPTSFTSSNGIDDGKLSRSPSGLHLTLAGFETSQATGALGGGSVNRRAAIAPFSASVPNNATFGFATATNMTPSGEVFCSATVDGSGYWIGTLNGLYYIASGSSTATQILTTPEGVYNLRIAGGNLWAVSDSGLVRLNGLPTTAGQTPTTVIADINIQAVEFIDATTMLIAYWNSTVNRGVRRGTISTGTWNTATTATTVTFTTVENTVAPILSNLVTDGVRAYSTNYAALPNTLRGYSNITGAATAVTLHTAGANFSYRGLALAPEPSIIGGDYSRTSGVQRFAMRLTGTGTDPFVRAVRVGNMNFSGHRTATTLATVPYRGQIVDMAVDASGNTIMLNVVPNATFTGYVYSIIRVSADGSSNDEGPVSAGAPSQAAPVGYMPIAIDASAGQAVVLMRSLTDGTYRVGVVTLPGSIGSGVTTVADWGPYTPTIPTQSAVDISYNATASNFNVLTSQFAAGTGSHAIFRVNTATPNDTTAQQTSTAANYLATSFSYSSDLDAIVMLSGSPINRLNRFRLDRLRTGSADAAGTEYTLDSTTTNTVTTQPIWNQMWPLSVHVDSGTGDAVVNFTGTNGSLNATALAGEARLNIPGSYRAWRMSTTALNITFASYRFFPGINFN